MEQTSVAASFPGSAGAVESVETPGYKERVFFLGANGSGKTILASRMLESYERCIVFDVKHDFPIPWEKGQYTLVSKPPHAGGIVNWWHWLTAGKHIIYRPVRPYDDGKHTTKFLDWTFDQARKAQGKKPTILYLDEGGWMSYGGARDAIARIAITGRSLNLGLWLSAQRPRGIPVEVRSEAWRWYVFYLRSRDDRKEVVNYLDYRVDERELESSTRDFEFWEIRRGHGGRMNYRRLPPVRPAPMSASVSQ